METRSVRSLLGMAVVPAAALLLLASAARGETVSYTANLHTSKGNPVTDILILEDDGAQVHASLYPSELPGRGTAVLSHEVPFSPVETLVIGLTEGQDTDGSDKTELVMFLDSDFAAAHAGVPFSSIFAGARHSTTVANLQQAAAGDEAQLAWFADTFFPGPANGAAFASRGPFTVAEFTSLKNIGENATAGHWMINSFQSLPANDGNAQSGKVTSVIGETAKTDNGPFDIELSIDGNGVFAIDKSVLNNTPGAAWRGFILQLGTGTGANFVPSTAGDGLGFDDGLNNREETGAFPQAVIGEDRIVFSGTLAQGGTARFVVFVSTDVIEDHLVTVRQIAIGATTPAPALSPPSLAILAVLLLGIGAFRIYRRQEG
jgi:hypothetical protein